ncbi:hypothetical protein [Candidatus Thiothrix anitrata]|uniref:Uncharacterized protein n=1 Tax=Candidatus Thiothrix anitrata TaxID=2823902 RepID=A0ABX7X0H3_9GAMM|nr:hypothetical protein [Candidatus Thiothrix anitrata]QTR48782.1 hypothetical protein J8380_10830 [Candidatus Thiothrix anitrata]
MTDTAVLRQVLQPAIVIPLDDHYNRKKLVLPLAVVSVKQSLSGALRFMRHLSKP